MHILQLIWDFLNPAHLQGESQAFLPLLIPLGIAAANAISGLSQSAKADKAIKELGDTPFPRFSLTPQMGLASARAEQMAQRGFTPEEEAAFHQNLARTDATGYQKSIDLSGGNLAGAISRGIQSQNIGANVDYAAKDALLHRGNIKYSDVLTRAIQAQQDLKTKADITRRTALETAYGREKMIGKQNALKALGMAGAVGYQSMLGTGMGAAASGSSSGSATGGGMWGTTALTKTLGNGINSSGIDDFTGTSDIPSTNLPQDDSAT